jgi:hypothetical protein
MIWRAELKSKRSLVYVSFTTPLALWVRVPPLTIDSFLCVPMPRPNGFLLATKL